MTGVNAPVFCFRYNPVMKWYRWLGTVLAVISAICLVISIWPFSEHSDKVSFSSSGGIYGTLQISQPDKVKMGNATTVSLLINVDPNINEVNPLTFFSKLELDSLTVTPRGEGQVSVDPSKPVKLKWQLIPYKAGVYSGTLWLFVKRGEVERDLILARPVELSVKTLFGLSYPMVKMISIITLVFASLLLIPKFRKK